MDRGTFDAANEGSKSDSKREQGSRDERNAFPHRSNPVGSKVPINASTTRLLPRRCGLAFLFVGSFLLPPTICRQVGN